MNPSCKLIAIDLDGTLLNHEGVVSKRVAEALRRAAAAGVQVVPASGRSYRGVVDVAKAIGADFAIAQHGALVRRVADHSTVHSNLIPIAEALEIASALDATGLEPFIAVDGYPDDAEYLFLRHPAQAGTRELLAKSDFKWEVVTPGEPLPHAGATQVGALAEKERVSRARDVLEERFGGAFTYMVLTSRRFEAWFVDVISNRATKAHALEALAGMLGIGMDSTAAVGDDINDLEMLRAAGVAVAMGNACAQVRDAADFLVSGNDRDGAAEAIDALVAGRF